MGRILLKKQQFFKQFTGWLPFNAQLISKRLPEGVLR